MDKWAVMGSPITHSLSPRLHQYFSRCTGIALEYSAIDVTLNCLATTLARIQRDGFRGCHITAPLKATAFTLCQPNSAAALAQSVNCITFSPNGARHGYNYDGVGLIMDLEQQSIHPENLRIAILGAGGAVRGILGPLLASKPREVVLINRTVERAEKLANYFAAHGPIRCHATTDTITTPFDLVIHASSAALHAQTPLHLPFATLAHSVCYDLSYGHGAVPFMLAARALGATQVVDGFGLLAAQAAANFHHCYGIYPPIRGLTASML